MANLTTKQKQGRLFKRTQNRLDRMLKLLRKVHLSKRAQPTENNELFEALVRRSLLNSMMSSGFSPGPFGLGSTASPTTVKLTTTTAEAEHEMDFNTLCTDKTDCNSNYIKGIIFNSDSCPYSLELSQQILVISSLIQVIMVIIRKVKKIRKKGKRLKDWLVGITKGTTETVHDSGQTEVDTNKNKSEDTGNNFHTDFNNTHIATTVPTLITTTENTKKQVTSSKKASWTDTTTSMVPTTNEPIQSAAGEETSGNGNDLNKVTTSSNRVTATELIATERTTWSDIIARLPVNSGNFLKPSVSPSNENQHPNSNIDKDGTMNTLLYNAESNINNTDGLNDLSADQKVGTDKVDGDDRKDGNTANSNGFLPEFIQTQADQRNSTVISPKGTWGLPTDVQRTPRDGFPQFPTELDFMLEVLEKSLNRIKKTCPKDIQGRDRACCNSAVKCFDDVRSVVDELDNAPAGSFTLSAACRRVGSELQRDRMCVQQSLSRCGGRERALLQRRFDKRVNNLYDQYNSYCRRTIQDTPTTVKAETTTIPGDTDSPRPIFPVTPTTNSTNQPRPPLPPGGDWGGHSGVGPTQGPPGDNSALTGGIIAGVITGGVILGIVLLVAVILWCRNRRDRNGSDSSTDSQGIFFQKQPARNNNNSKPSATRQLSDPYAEIDETLVNPGYKPPVPSSMTLPDYLHPVSDDGSSNYTAPPTSGRHGSAPAITTRGQLSYGPILAANREASKGMVTPYHTTSITTNEDIQRFKDRDLSNADTLPSSRNLLANSETPIVNTDTFAEDVDDFGEIEGQDDYEQPVSANSSVRYAAIDHGPPKTVAPAVPTSGSSMTPPSQSKHKKVGLKVLPSNPLSPILSVGSPERESEMSGNDAVTSPNSPMSDVNSTTSPAQPVPKPRNRKENKDSADSENAPLNINGSGNVFTFKETQGIGFKELMKRTDPDAANRDSCVSDASVKSSHHYYVLEPGHNKTEYENSVSSPKMV